jgi:hypothetical protein
VRRSIESIIVLPESSCYSESIHQSHQDKFVRLTVYSWQPKRCAGVLVKLARSSVHQSCLKLARVNHQSYHSLGEKKESIWYSLTQSRLKLSRVNHQVAKQAVKAGHSCTQTVLESCKVSYSFNLHQSYHSLTTVL